MFQSIVGRSWIDIFEGLWGINMANKNGEKGQTKIDIFHKPDWHPSLSSIYGDIKGQYGYVTEIGTIALLGPDTRKDAEVSKFVTETDLKGPLASITAVGGLI